MVSEKTFEKQLMTSQLLGRNGPKKYNYNLPTAENVFRLVVTTAPGRILGNLLITSTGAQVSDVKHWVDHLPRLSLGVSRSYWSICR